MNNNQKCYNSFSCVLSVLIILFVVFSIGYDMMVTKPQMRKNIEEIRVEVKDIHSKIDSQFVKDSLSHISTLSPDTLTLISEEDNQK